MRGHRGLFFLGVFLAWGALPALGATYLTVNRKPQISLEADAFQFYWALWRTLTPAERAVLQPTGGGHLYGLRQLVWRARGCEPKARWKENSETLWTWDEIRFQANGEIQPLREAPWSDHLYFVQANFNSRHARGLWGELVIRSEHRVLPRDAAPLPLDFTTIDDYRPGHPDYEEFMGRLHPIRWPVYYDERAHKPHSIHLPQAWERKKPAPLSVSVLEMRLIWDGCTEPGKMKVKALFPPGGLPAAGPNRFGRDEDSGRDSLFIEETSDWLAPRGVPPLP